MMSYTKLYGFTQLLHRLIHGRSAQYMVMECNAVWYRPVVAVCTVRTVAVPRAGARAMRGARDGEVPV